MKFVLIALVSITISISAYSAQAGSVIFSGTFKAVPGSCDGISYFGILANDPNPVQVRLSEQNLTISREGSSQTYALGQTLIGGAEGGASMIDVRSLVNGGTHVVVIEDSHGDSLLLPDYSVRMNLDPETFKILDPMTHEITQTYREILIQESDTDSKKTTRCILRG